MTEQGLLEELFDHLSEHAQNVHNRLPPYQRESETSRGAAVAVRDDVQGHKRMIHNWLISRGQLGGTYTEIADGTGILPQTVTARINSMRMSDGTVSTNGKRKTAYGHQATIYVAVTGGEG
jgi:hypothetical protein